MTTSDPRLTFFPKRKVRAYLKGWVPKMNNEGEKRIRLDFEVPLLDEAREGMIPGWIINSLNAMEAEGSKESDTEFDTVIEGVTLEFWDTPKSSGRALLLTAATLDCFMLRRVKRDGQTFIALAFNTNVKRADALKWADKYEACYVWVEATPSAIDQPSKAVPGEQMTLADATAAQTEQSLANVKSHFGTEENGEDPTAIEDAPKPDLSGDMPVQDEVRAAACETADEGAKPEAGRRRPRGFGGSTGKHVN